MKSGIMIVVSLFILVGCGAVEPPVITTDRNTFSSSKSPSIQIQLNEEFQFLGSYDNKFQARTLGDTGQTFGTKKNNYLYPQLSQDKYLKKMFGISVLELPVGRKWHPNTMLVVKNPLRESIVKLGEKNFQYCIKAKEATNRLTQQYLLEKGITTPRCYMWMLFGRVYGDNVKLYISLYEDNSNFKKFGINSCADWKDKKMLNEKQKEYLKEFEKRAHNSLKIL